MISYINWATSDVLAALGFSPQHRLTGIHLSLDGLRVEARVELSTPIYPLTEDTLADVSND